MSFSCDFYYGDTPKGQPNPNYGRILMTVAGADGEIAPEEWAVLEGIAEILHIPPQAIENDRDFDWKNAKLEDLIRGGDTAKHALVYDMIRVAGGDLNYGSKEERKVERAAQLLGVDQATVNQLEDIVKQEDELRRRKRALIFPSGRRG